MQTEIIRCSDCASRYVVPKVMLPPPGRRVRCRACGYSWFEVRDLDDEFPDEAFGTAYLPLREPLPTAPFKAYESVRHLLRDNRGVYPVFTHTPLFHRATARRWPGILVVVLAGILVLMAFVLGLSS